MAYATLGAIKFEGLRSFSDFTQTDAANYAVLATVSGKPVVQRIGDELREIALSVYLHHSFCDVAVNRAAFTDALNAGTILPLSSGDGVYLGDFYIKSIEQQYDALHSDGSLWAIRLSVSLLEAGKSTDGVNATKPAGFAIATVSPRVVAPLTPAITPAAIAMQPVTAAGSEIATTSTRLRTVAGLETAGESAVAAYAKARESADRLLTAARDIAAYKTTLATFEAATVALVAAIDAQDVTAALASIDDITRRLNTDVQPAFLADLQKVINREI